MAGTLTKRIAFAIPAILVTTGLLWLGGAGLQLAIAILGVLGAREVYDLAHRHAVEPLGWLGYLCAAALPFLAHDVPGAALARVGGGVLSELLITFWLFALLLVAMRRGPTRRPLAAVGITCFGALYPSLPLTFLLLIRHGRGATALAGFALVLFPLVLTWICDTFAYMVGSQFGGPKMAPVLSPKKTWSGAVGGAVGAVLAAVLLGLVVVNRVGWSFTIPQLLGLGLVVGVAAQVGDVAESLLKREAGVKDSSDLIPGHGGVLDRLDSLYFVIPASAALFDLYGAI
jgi:phosphatidate cytidylyltransferase